MRKMLPLLFLGGAAIAYFFYRKKEAANPSIPTSRPSNYQPAQPSQMYPWQPIVPPRVDNANQPWYNNAPLPKGPSGFQDVAGAIQAGSSVVHSLKDVWGDMSDWFGSDAGQSLDTSDNYAGIGFAEETNLSEDWDFDDSWDQANADEEWDWGVA